jgi:hypothetical protein
MFDNVSDWPFGANICLHGQRTMAKTNATTSFLRAALASSGGFVEERAHLAVKGQESDRTALVELGAAAFVTKHLAHGVPRADLLNDERY